MVVLQSGGAASPGGRAGRCLDRIPDGNAVADDAAKPGGGFTGRCFDVGGI